MLCLRMQGDASARTASVASSAPPNIRETAVVYSWVQYRITHYLEALRKHLPNITEGGNLASVLEHCTVRPRVAWGRPASARSPPLWQLSRRSEPVGITYSQFCWTLPNLPPTHTSPQYCGSSLSRVGLDFQGLLHPLFESATLNLFAGHLAAAAESFNARLEVRRRTRGSGGQGAPRPLPSQSNTFCPVGP